MNKSINQTINEIRKMAEEVAAREGCFLYDIEFVGGGQGRTLRVYIDKEASTAAPADETTDQTTDETTVEMTDAISEGATSGATIEDCSNVSRGLNLLLDVEDVVPGGNYLLEVSTPGLERVLKERRHFEAAMGKKILVKTFQPLAEFNPHLSLELGKAKQIQGKLLAYTSVSIAEQPGASAEKAGLRVQFEGPTGEQNSSADAAALGSAGRDEVFIPLQTVTKAHVVFEFADPAEKKKSLKKGKAKK